ncbi:MAG: hypothetical protein HZB65_03180 [Candidatus Aenigmarchaeota archaeon]|nr:hypothetical protein [Candidatus Aenigmarchaeota archaeon]
MLLLVSSIAYSAEEINCLDLAALQTEQAKGILISEKTSDPTSQRPIDKETGLPTTDFSKAYKFDCLDVIKEYYNVNDLNDLKKFPLNTIYKSPYNAVIAPNLKAQQGCIAYHYGAYLGTWTGAAEKQYFIEQLRCYKNDHGKQPAFYCKASGPTQAVYNPVKRTYYSPESETACDKLSVIGKPYNICPEGSICIERDPYTLKKLGRPVCAAVENLPKNFNPWTDIDKIKEGQVIRNPSRRG